MRTQAETAAKPALRVGIAQLNPRVGDIAGNLLLAERALHKAQAEQLDIVLFSELFLSGYPPEDLLLKPAFIDACFAALESLAAKTRPGGAAALIGLPLRRGRKLYNAAALLEDGKVTALRCKTDLPNYDEFDEKRWFSPGRGRYSAAQPVVFRGVSLGMPICEDIWNDAAFCQKLRQKGAELILSLHASPYSRGKWRLRRAVAAKQAEQSGLPLIYANQFGGQDELMFDGGSFAVGADGQCVAQARHFSEDFAVTRWEKRGANWQCAKAEMQRVMDGDEADYTACMLGLRDYLGKNGFKKAVLGLSGGIDSALCAAMAVDALGAENVEAVMLPYHYTGAESLRDAEACAAQLGCSYQILPVKQAVDAAAAELAPFLESGKSLAEAQKAAESSGMIWFENVQSRMRGLFLMAVSNKSGAMVITTGNKSEMAVGFATLYGDMNGGFNPIKDLYKMQVYALSHWRSAHKPHGGKGKSGAVIPQAIIDKAPSAELSPGQLDADRLPPYPVLDAVLHGLVEEEQSCAALTARGFSREVVERVEHLLYIAEYKRRQSAPGVKLGQKPFGKLRRYPIANGFRTAGRPRR